MKLKIIKILEITTNIGCKNRCTYCPQEKIISAYKKRSDIFFMSLYTFKKCIDRLNNKIRINFSGFSEPFLNKKCKEMILYSHRKGLINRVFTTMAGLTDEIINSIKHIPFERFEIHLADSMSLMKIKPDEEYLRKLRMIIESDISSLSLMCIGQPHPEIEQIVRKNGYNIDIKIHEYHSRAGNLDDSECQEKLTDGPIFCSRCFTMQRNVLLPNGEIALCCMDYNLEHILGSLLENSYNSLFRGDEYNRIVGAQKSGDGDILCMRCFSAAARGSSSYIKYKSIKFLKAITNRA